MDDRSNKVTLAVEEYLHEQDANLSSDDMSRLLKIIRAVVREEMAIKATDDAIEASRNPPPRVRAAAEFIHDQLTHYGKSYKELEETDPIGFGEFNSVVWQALDKADKAVAK